MNNMIRDSEKLERGTYIWQIIFCQSVQDLPSSYVTETNPKIFHGPQVEKMMKRQTSLAAHSYDVCVNGCKLYNLEDGQTTCIYCNSERFEVDSPRKSLSTMKIMSIGDIISRLLANPDTHAELRYRHEYDNRENVEPNVIADFFDGEEYKAFKNNNNFQNEHDVAIAVFDDGFVTKKSRRAPLHYDSCRCSLIQSSATL
ncbi:hypothetical protein BD408DRAFT_165030 [Parasitella parasitica]|nr:hypothetical protein BD408DRAFT_165030 [Parasitella parasitica]